MLLARIEAHDEVEAAEQRFTAALAHDRAQLAKQARSLLSTHGRWLQGPSLVLLILYATDHERDGCTCSACGILANGVMVLCWRQAFLTITCHALLTECYPLPRCTKRAPRRALRRRRQPSSGWPRVDQARCEEREAAVREALALGALPVRTPWPQAKGPMLHSGQRSRRPCLV